MPRLFMYMLYVNSPNLNENFFPQLTWDLPQLQHLQINKHFSKNILNLLLVPNPNSPKDAVRTGDNAVADAAKISAEPPATTGNETEKVIN